jgi:hypothetical protein
LGLNSRPRSCANHNKMIACGASLTGDEAGDSAALLYMRAKYMSHDSKLRGYSMTPVTVDEGLVWTFLSHCPEIEGARRHPSAAYPTLRFPACRRTPQLHPAPLFLNRSTPEVHGCFHGDAMSAIKPEREGTLVSSLYVQGIGQARGALASPCCVLIIIH